LEFAEYLPYDTKFPIILPSEHWILNKDKVRHTGFLFPMWEGGMWRSDYIYIYIYWYLICCIIRETNRHF
jgi:hypothetical protein